MVHFCVCLIKADLVILFSSLLAEFKTFPVSCLAGTASLSKH